MLYVNYSSVKLEKKLYFDMLHNKLVCKNKNHANGSRLLGMKGKIYEDV